MSIVLPIKIGTTDTSKVHSVKALLDSGATGNFIDKDFVCTKGISTQSISRPIPVFNVDGSPNEAGQIVKYGAEQERSGPESSGITPEWMEFDNKVGTTLASARALYLDLLSRVWLCISGGMNCCQEFWRGMV